MPTINGREFRIGSAHYTGWGGVAWYIGDEESSLNYLCGETGVFLPCPTVEDNPSTWFRTREDTEAAVAKFLDKEDNWAEGKPIPLF